ncbi:BA75_03670T0 [Komagataella pastoris]|uniref:BA75_03670T0 n=1 Tax=Komagataella pastoris TaxID=4922 RepID=A0A1B2JFH5_PICPA|nr:BA75_03670T0 [Komagataella pastoris]
MNRATLNLENVPYYNFLRKWKVPDLIMIAVLFGVNIILWTSAPYERQFSINDLTISHPFAEHERVSTHQLFNISFGLPSVAIFFFGLLLTESPHKIYVTYLSLVGFLVSFYTNLTITDILKNWIGRCRPDFLARCIPSPDALPDVLYFAKDICTNDDWELVQEGFRTTPSGHSSIAFSTLFYLTLFLSGQFFIGHKDVGTWRHYIAGLPTLGAAYIAISRTADYRHHFVDVILGSVIGTLVAWWSYRRYYPSIYSEKSYIPYNLEDEDPCYQPADGSCQV